MVQVAAVSNPEDAQVLVNALRQRSYPVTARRGPGDDYIHVRVGPFATRAIAEQWKAKLLNDGYNAVVLHKHPSLRAYPRIHSGKPEAMLMRIASIRSPRVA